MNGILFTLCIFGAKLAEVTLGSIKYIFLGQGRRLYATVCSFIEILIYGFILSGLIDGLSDNLGWLFAYCGGYSAGVFCGSWITEKLALGSVCLQIIAERSDEISMLKCLAENGCSYTKMNGEGSQTLSAVILSVVSKRKAKKISENVKSVCQKNVFVIVSGVEGTFGGSNVSAPRFSRLQ